MYIYLLIQTLQCEQMEAFCRLLRHKSVNYFFALNSYDAITNAIPVSARTFACMSFHIGGFLLCGIVIKPSRGPNNCRFWAMTEAEGEVGYP